MHEFVAAERNCDVCWSCRDRAEEDQIPGLQFLRLHRFSRFELFDDGARERNAVLAEHVPREAAAIEP